MLSLIFCIIDDHVDHNNENFEGDCRESFDYVEKCRDENAFDENNFGERILRYREKTSPSAVPTNSMYAFASTALGILS